MQYNTCKEAYDSKVNYVNTPFGQKFSGNLGPTYYNLIDLLIEKLVLKLIMQFRNKGKNMHRA